MVKETWIQGRNILGGQMKTVRINDLVKRNKQILRRRKVIEKKLKELQQEDNELLKELERNNNFFTKRGMEQIK